MRLTPALFDEILATGESRRSSRSPWTGPDIFGVHSLTPPTRVTYQSLDEAVETLIRARKQAAEPK
jgi:hypothetical protein